MKHHGADRGRRKGKLHDIYGGYLRGQSGQEKGYLELTKGPGGRELEATRGKGNERTYCDGK